MLNTHQLQKIAKANGSVVIKYKMLEELEELIAALKSNDDIDILDEMADVSVMILQYIMTYGLKEKITKRMNYKIKRTIERLGLK